MPTNLEFQLALTIIPNIGNVLAKNLIEVYGNAEDIFKAPAKHLEKVEGIGPFRASAIKSFKSFELCDEEIKFIQNNNIEPLFITDPKYPKHLLNCYDSPTLLFYKGNADLNNTKIVSIVGTRTNSEYGKQTCEKFISDIKSQNVIVVSGLAFGIDTISHKAALNNGIKTVALLAHGLDRIYPSQNKQLADEMIDNGGLLTEFRSNTMPDKQNFPLRNRIVAGICDALIIIESAKSGGSLITVALANGYNKDVFAIPGRVSDIRSEGCNYAIQNNKAILINNAKDFLQFMNWESSKTKTKKVQRQLFLELTADEKTLVEILQSGDAAHIDEIYKKTNMSSSAIASALLTLEMQLIIASLPGKIYKLL